MNGPAIQKAIVESKNKSTLLFYEMAQFKAGLISGQKEEQALLSELRKIQDARDNIVANGTRVVLLSEYQAILNIIKAQKEKIEVKRLEITKVKNHIKKLEGDLQKSHDKTDELESEAEKWGKILVLEFKK